MIRWVRTITFVVCLAIGLGLCVTPCCILRASVHGQTYFREVYIQKEVFVRVPRRSSITVEDDAGR